MMGRDSREVGSLFYLIHLLIWVKLVPDLCLNFVDKVLKNYDINSSKISKNKGKKTCKIQVCNQQRFN